MLDLGLDSDYELFANPVDVDAVIDALPRLERWRHWFTTHYGLVDLGSDTATESGDLDAESIVGSWSEPGGARRCSDGARDKLRGLIGAGISPGELRRPRASCPGTQDTPEPSPFRLERKRKRIAE